MALDLLGKPDWIDAIMTPASTGIDEQCAIRFHYKNGAIANLFCTLASNLASGGDIEERRAAFGLPIACMGQQHCLNIIQERLIRAR